MTFKLKDTFSGIREFIPFNKSEVKIYTCGPTVYDYVTIGNLRAFITADILKKSIKYLGYTTFHVMNITDVGHLLGDLEDTEDKLEKSSRIQNKTVWEVAQFYSDYFFSAVKKVNVDIPDVVSKATDTIQEQIEIIQLLEKKGYVYKTETGVYFDVSKVKDYSKLAKRDLNEQVSGVREKVVLDKTKKSQWDFRLWQTAYPDHQMQWDSPWGKGFPGWHIECSSIVHKFIGNSIDIHTGGIDLVFPHHTNEIVQSESAFGKPFVNFWVHNNFINIDGTKISKSLNNGYKIEDLENRGFNPISLRYLYMIAHYSSVINFTFDSLSSAQEALDKIYVYLKLNKEFYNKNAPVDPVYKEKFVSAIENNIDTPSMLEVLWGVFKDENLNQNIPVKIATLLDFDKVLGFNFINHISEDKLPADILKLVEDRKVARKNKNWILSDELRNNILSKGYLVIDTDSDTIIIRS